jgi:hypothetical protein
MQLSDTIDRKFLEQFQVSDWEVETDTGWRDITYTNKTIEYRVFRIITSTGRTLLCADNHILFDEYYNEIFAKDCLEKSVQTNRGLEKVISIVDTGVSETMYDLSVDSLDHRYYTNGFLSHNSTTCAVFLCHYIIFNDNKTCAILANKAATAREILARVQLVYEYLPKWLQHGVTEWNKGSFQLENGSRILASATSSSAIRGFSINCCMIDEHAFIPTNLAEEFFTSVYPTLSSGKDSKIIVVSTPNGMNHFYKMWQEAIDGINGFDTVSADWRAVPWRDEKWAAEQKGVLGEQKFAQEMECQFIGASNTLINGSKLVSIPISQPILQNNNTTVFAKPEQGRKYVMMVDTARGTGNDYSAFVVVDITEIPYQVVFKYRNNTISSMVYPNIVHRMAVEYNNCPVMIETNEIGESVANDLYYSLEYEETIMSRGGDVVLWGNGTTSPGVRTTTKTKRIGCDILKQLVENDKLIINDYDILHELSNFVVKGKSYEADVGHDDLVMCLVMFSYLTTTPKFEEMTDSSVKNRIIMERREAEEFDMIPTGFYTDGTEKEEEIFNF